MVKYLTKLGWRVTVVTPNPRMWARAERHEDVKGWLAAAGIKTIYTGHRLRFLSSGHLARPPKGSLYWLMCKLGRKVAMQCNCDEMVGWYPEILEGCKGLEPGDVDVVLVTGGPFGAFEIANSLAKRLGAGLVLDYRDPWNGNPHDSKPPSRKVFDCERRLLNTANAVTIVTESWARQLQIMFGNDDKISVISNGYDPVELADIRADSFHNPSILYSGQFYPPKRAVDPLLNGLRQVSINRPDLKWVFNYFGPDSVYVSKAAAESGLGDRVVVHGVVSRTSSLMACRGSKLAVVISSVNENASLSEMGIVTGKIYEAIGLRTPYIAIGPRGSDLHSLCDSVGGGFVRTGADSDGIAECVSRTLDGLAPAWSNADVCAWTNVVHRLSDVLESAVL